MSSELQGSGVREVDFDAFRAHPVGKLGRSLGRDELLQALVTSALVANPPAVGAHRQDALERAHALGQLDDALGHAQADAQGVDVAKLSKM